MPPAAADVVEVEDAFLLRPDPPDAVDIIDLESSGVRQKNSSSAEDDSPNFPLLIIFEELLGTFPDNIPVCY